jgi:hypothetical protein
MKATKIRNRPGNTTPTIRLGRRLAAAALFIATAGFGFGSFPQQAEPSPASAIAGDRTSLHPKVSRMNHLGASMAGRLVLHTVCLIRHPENAVWHWHGILREFAH